jgi:hypothetical protein
VTVRRNPVHDPIDEVTRPPAFFRRVAETCDGFLLPRQSLVGVGDHRQLDLSLPVYDALYPWCENEVAAIA